jgi:hypothetical protein
MSKSKNQPSFQKRGNGMKTLTLCFHQSNNQVECAISILSSSVTHVTCDFSSLIISMTIPVKWGKLGSSLTRQVPKLLQHSNTACALRASKQILFCHIVVRNPGQPRPPDQKTPLLTFPPPAPRTKYLSRIGIRTQVDRHRRFRETLLTFPPSASISASSEQ